MSYFQVYLFTRLDAILAVFVVGLICMAIAISIWIVISAVEEEWESFKRWGRWVVAAFLFFLSGAVLITTQKEAAAIYLIPKITNSEDVKGISSDMLSVLKLKLSAYLDALEGKKNE